MAVELVGKLVGNIRNWSRGDLKEVPNCPACGNCESDPAIFERHDDGGVMPDVWRMVQCSNCRSLYLSPRPDEESLPRAYEDYYTHQAEATDTPASGAPGLMWRMVNGYLNLRFGMHREPHSQLGFWLFSMIEPWRLKLDYFGRHLTRRLYPQRGRLLDVGCGNGAFLLRAHDMGWDAVGCETDPQAVEACRNQGLTVFCGDAFHDRFEKNSFDIITISHVVEHVSDPSLLLQRMFDLLRPSGVLWLALPNPESIGLNIFGAAWRGLHFPYHLCIPSQRILSGWLIAAGFPTHQRIRRGAHAHRQWVDSQAIAHRGEIRLSSPLVLLALRILIDLLATFSTRWAEETVMVARKPGHQRGR